MVASFFIVFKHFRVRNLEQHHELVFDHLVSVQDILVLKSIRNSACLGLTSSFVSVHAALHLSGAEWVEGVCDVRIVLDLRRA